MDAAKEFYDAWAAFYDADYADQDIGDEEFYLDLAQNADGPVLEVGCGTGRIYLDLLRAGVDAYGIDISESMLETLREKARERGLAPTVRQADMAAFQPEREYDLVIVPFRAFLHNLTLADRRATLQNLHDALTPGGTLALNVFVPSFEVICESYGEEETRTVTRDGEEYCITDVAEIEDEVAQVVRAERTVERDGDVVRDGTFRIALVSKAEFELLFEQTGWSDWTGYGGFDGEPLEVGAREMVWVAKK